MPGQKITFKTKTALKTFGSGMIYFDFERTAETYISVHNAKVRENREILKDPIDINCFPAKQQLAVCSNDESSISSTRGNCVELLHTLAAKDEKLARHLESRDIYCVFWLLKHDSKRFNCRNR